MTRGKDTALNLVYWATRMLAIVVLNFSERRGK